MAESKSSTKVTNGQAGNNTNGKQNGVNNKPSQGQLAMNEMPIYSQVQKPNNSNNSAQNRNLIITNGTTNADSWV